MSRARIVLTCLLLPAALVAAGAAAVELPQPELSGLEPAVAEQLGQMHALAAAQVADPDLPPEAVADTVGELGRLYHAYDLRPPAEACYREAEKLAPRDFRWPYHLAYLLQTDGRLEEAARKYERSLAIVPEVTPALIRLGHTSLSLGRLEAAERNFREAQRLDAASAAAAAGLGQVYLAREEYDLAAEQLELASRMEPEANRLHHLLGMAYRGQGRVEEARRLLEKSGPVGVAPGDPLIDGLRKLTTGERVHLLRGRAALRAERLEDAAREFGLAVESNPESIPGRINLGTVLARRGEVEAAITQFLRVAELAPANTTAHFNLGSLYASRGESEAALAAFREAALYAPEDAEIRFRFAEALESNDRLEEALLHYRKSAELSPPGEQARLGEARVLVTDGRFREARQALERSVAALPESQLLAFALGRILAQCPDPNLRDGERALQLARQVFWADPTFPHAELVGSALAEAGRCEEAALFLGEVLAQAEEAESPPPMLSRLTDIQRGYEAGPPCRP